MDDRRMDAGVTGILIAHLGAFGSGELKRLSERGFNNVVLFDSILYVPSTIFQL